ncbi:cytochrome P450 89A2-like [Nicotiana tomentosiformis]|uniref:cytochrome P450 89A2-like n=1 Tax=Nicotiana tomentosiformis TaxID=4098 RepID=UPI00388C6332
MTNTSTGIMESLFIIVVTFCISFFLILLFNLFFQKTKKLPPGPFIFPVIGMLPLLRKTSRDLELMLRDLKRKYGPIIAIKIGYSSPSIVISSHLLAYQALVQQGAICSDRPIASTTSKIFNSNQRTIASSSYGPTWRLLRRNLISEMLHPSRIIKSHSKNRAWVLGILIQKLLLAHESAAADYATEAIMLLDHFKYAIFCLLVLICFGNKLDEFQIEQIKDAQHRALKNFHRFRILDYFPEFLGKTIFRKRWKELIELRKELDGVFIPLIQDRVKYKLEAVGAPKPGVDHHHKEEEELEADIAYVDTLVNLELPEEKRKLNYQEMASLCGEFLAAASDTTYTALQWIMACLVKYPSIQEKLYKEICQVVESTPLLQSIKNNKVIEEAVKEEDLQKMPYLKAVILEGLRRHPPTHFVLPHRVTEDMELNGYVIPKNATINFMVGEMGLDPNVWDDPMEFKPERFLVDGDGTLQEFDITGSREIKMMPFGAGRRICPGYGSAMLHLQYFVANLIWQFEWKPVEGDEVDLTEGSDFTVTMKNPLRARISPRCCTGSL